MAKRRDPICVRNGALCGAHARGMAVGQRCNDFPRKPEAVIERDQVRDVEAVIGMLGDR